MSGEKRTVRTVDLLGVFWRSFFLQSSWSYDRMQSLGFAFALLPVLRRLYGKGGEFPQRLAAHMEYFNTQPYFASFILGAAAKREEERAAGTEEADPSEVKKTLMAPLGALGDSFFWGALRPLAAAIAVATFLAGAWWAPILFLVLYNAVHVTLRWVLIREGYRTGGDAVALMGRYNFTGLARVFKLMTLSVIGVVAGMFPVWGPWRDAGTALPMIAVAGLASSLGLLALMRGGGTPLQLMLGLAALCCGFALGGLF